MLIDSIITFNNNMFDNVLTLIITDAISVVIANIYDKVFLVFLSFFLNIGKFTVSAGAYRLIIIIEKTNVINTAIYLVYIGVHVTYLLIITFP